jgi:hypothetical protein
MIHPTMDVPHTAPPPIPQMPTANDVPRGSAVDAEIMAATMLAAVQAWAPKALAAGDYRGAGELRRRLGPVAATIYRRKLSATATLDAQQAARIVDRVAGRTVRDGQAAGEIYVRSTSGKRNRIPVADIVGHNDRSGLYRLGEATEEEFQAAIASARASGSLAMETVVGHLGIKDLTPRQQAQRDRIAEMAEQGFTSRQIAAELKIKPMRVSALSRRYGITIHGDSVSRNTRNLDPIRIITETIPIIDGLAHGARQLADDDIARIDPAQAKDWARQLGQALGPVAALQRSLRDRGKEE